MHLIAHRGNTSGPNPKRENTPEYIEEAIEKGFDVEIDIRAEIDTDCNSLRYILGHDQGDSEVSYQWLLRHVDKLWVHCKNLTALHALHGSPLNYFWHQEDDFTLTSYNVIWTYPHRKVTDKSVIVCFTEEEAIFYADEHPCLGICCDWVGKLK